MMRESSCYGHVLPCCPTEIFSYLLHVINIRYEEVSRFNTLLVIFLLGQFQMHVLDARLKRLLTTVAQRTRQSLLVLSLNTTIEPNLVGNSIHYVISLELHSSVTVISRVTI